MKKIYLFLFCIFTSLAYGEDLKIKESENYILSAITYENKKEYEEAFKYYLKAAELGNSIAQNKIGMYYFKEKKYLESFNWYKKSAESGNSMGLYNLAKYYRDNLILEKNEKKYFELMLESANKNNPLAAFSIANAYSEGISVEKDIKKSIIWHEKAYKLGFFDSLYYIALLNEELGEFKDSAAYVSVYSVLPEEYINIRLQKKSYKLMKYLSFKLNKKDENYIKNKAKEITGIIKKIKPYTVNIN